MSPRLAAIAFWVLGNGRYAVEHIRGQRSREMRRVQEDPNAVGYLMAGGAGVPPALPPPPGPNPLLDVAPEEVWREIEREALR